jgi:hypothetical protein
VQYLLKLSHFYSNLYLEKFNTPMKFKQSPSSVLMVRPSAFGYNSETAESNAFQQKGEMDSVEILKKAQTEFDRMVALLESHDVNVYVFPDLPMPKKPDAVFPNNWISFHEDGKVILYPMLAVNRRVERRQDIIDNLQKDFIINETIDLSAHELEGTFLEGTGSIIFDHANRIAYACRSPRTSENLFHQLCSTLNYRPVIFDSMDRNNKPIYHTNVMMAIGTKFVVICLDSIRNESNLDLVLDSFASTGHKVIALNYDQLENFAGNLFELETGNGDKGVLISDRAFKTLLPGQIDAITRSAEMIPVDIKTIETYGGGSVRCMVAGIHLKRK